MLSSYWRSCGKSVSKLLEYSAKYSAVPFTSASSAAWRLKDTNRQYEKSDNKRKTKNRCKAETSKGPYLCHHQKRVAAHCFGWNLFKKDKCQASMLSVATRIYRSRNVRFLLTLKYSLIFLHIHWDPRCHQGPCHLPSFNLIHVTVFSLSGALDRVVRECTLILNSLERFQGKNRRPLSRFTCEPYQSLVEAYDVTVVSRWNNYSTEIWYKVSIWLVRGQTQKRQFHRILCPLHLTVSSGATRVGQTPSKTFCFCLGSKKMLIILRTGTVGILPHDGVKFPAWLLVQVLQYVWSYSRLSPKLPPGLQFGFLLISWWPSFCVSPIFATWAMDINTPQDWWLFLSCCS
jgi:hypothetical protein